MRLPLLPNPTYRGLSRPRRFDRNLIVIGAGSGGLVCAYLAAALKARVTLIEKGAMGGDCLNTGCVPSKALIRTARLLEQIRRAGDYGVGTAQVEFDFAAAMERVQGVIAQVAPHDSVERYQGLGVEVIRGEAFVHSPWEVEVNGRRLTARSLILATGARPDIPAIPGINQIDYLTSESLWGLRELPSRLLVLGAGPIACELGQCFARFGSAVTLVQRGSQILKREDPELAERVAERLRSEGVRLATGHTPQAFRREGSRTWLVAEYQGSTVELEFDRLLVATGRRARVEGFGLEGLGIDLTPERRIAVNDHLQTRFPNVYAVGDAAGPHLFTHAAAHQAGYATLNGLLGGVWRLRVDYSALPWATFTDPELARVGLSEGEAIRQGIPYEVTRYDLAELDRAIADGDNRGFIKVLTVPGKARILGAAIVGPHAGELIGEFATAMRHGLGLNKILSTIHPYPTWGEANRHLAGAWRRAHAPAALMPWLERFHRWMR